MNLSMKKFVFLTVLFSSNLVFTQSDLIYRNGFETFHLTYFGFTLIDTYWDDPTDTEIKSNYLDEVANFTNMADILVLNPSDNIIARLTAMNDVQVKSILHLNEIFFEQNGTSSPSGVNYDLRLDYQSRWDEFINTNNLIVNKEKILCFYLGEEPTWNGISFNDLQSAADYIKVSLPTVPILIIEAYPAIAQLQVPNSVDWVGFDHYFIKNPSSDIGYLTELTTLKSKLSTTKQKLVIVMDAHYISSLHGDLGGISLDEMQDVANSYYSLAQSEPLVIALLAYFWPSGFDVPSSIGARNMPLGINQNYRRIGNEIILNAKNNKSVKSAPVSY